MDHVDKGWCNLLKRIDGDVLQRGIVADAHEGCGATGSGRKGEVVTTHTRNGGKRAKNGNAHACHHPDAHGPARMSVMYCGRILG